MSLPVPELADRATACADILRESDHVLLVSHIDADGLTSASVAVSALSRAGCDVDVWFSKQLDTEQIEALTAHANETILFTDFGSGQLAAILEHGDTDRIVICDHHEPAPGDAPYHLNPHLFGIDGSKEISGAGTAYVLARALGGESNCDLAGLAVVGAVGDMQASEGELHGANASIVKEAVTAGVLDTATDLSFYGTQTRPLPKLLEYASDVRIPGITNDRSGSRKFLEDQDIELKDGDEWRRWVDLTMDEKRRVVGGLVTKAMHNGVKPERIETLTGTTYTLLDEVEGTELRDASEFSTLLNATARYDRADVGLAVCLGDRNAAYTRAKRLLANHRRNLSEGLEWVRSNGVTTESHLQWFDAGTRIPDTIVGIVAGMALGIRGIDGNRPIIAFAEESTTELKVSGRGTARLVRNGLDLSEVMREASTAVGGDGGGHTVAAGATIPASQRDAFLAHADEIVGTQMSSL